MAHIRRVAHEEAPTISSAEGLLAIVVHQDRGPVGQARGRKIGAGEKGCQRVDLDRNDLGVGEEPTGRDREAAPGSTTRPGSEVSDQRSIAAMIGSGV